MTAEGERIPRKSSFRTKVEIEDIAIEDFRQFLKQERGKEFRISGRNVPTGNGKNYDFLLETDSGERMAVEQFLLIEGEGDYAVRKLVDELRVETIERMKRAGLTGVHVHSTGLDKLDIKAIRREVTDSVSEFLKRGAIPKAEVQIGVLRFGPIPPTLKEHVLWDHFPDRRVDGPREARESLLKNLEKKNSQLSVNNAERTVLISNGNLLIEVEDLRSALDGIDLSQFPNIDSIYFGYGVGQIHRIR